MNINQTLRVNMIKEIIRAAVRYRMDDTKGDLSLDTIDQMTTDADRAFVLRTLRYASPLFPLPVGET